jgi:hypothetical protein
MTDIGKLIEKNDDKLKMRESELIDKVNARYEKAIKNAIREFKVLEKIDSKVSNAQVRKIIEKTMKAFEEEMNKLIHPIAEATQDSYKEGLSETGQILKETLGE